MFIVVFVITFVRIERNQNNYALVNYFHRWFYLNQKDAVSTICCVISGIHANCMNQYHLDDVNIDNVIFSTADYLDDDVCVVYHRIKNNNYYSKYISLSERFDVQIGDISTDSGGSEAWKTYNDDGAVIGPDLMKEKFLFRFRLHPHLINVTTIYVGPWGNLGSKVWEDGGGHDRDAELCWSWKNITIGPYQELNLSYFVYPEITTLPLVLNISSNVSFIPDSKSLIINGRAYDPNVWRINFQPTIKLLMSVNGNSFKIINDSFVNAVNEFQITINILDYPEIQMEERKNISLRFYLEAPSRKNSRMENLTLFFEDITPKSTNSINGKSLYCASNCSYCAKKCLNYSNKRLNCSNYTSNFSNCTDKCSNCTDKCSNCTNCNKQSNCPSACPRCAICLKFKDDMYGETDQEIAKIARGYYKKYIRGEFEEEFWKNYENIDFDYEKGMYFIPIIEI